MNRIYYLLIFLLIVFASGACKKSASPTPQDVFLKLFPLDSSYKTGGCFQLAGGNYIIYGFDPDNGGVLPLIIETDQNGKIIDTTKLPAIFHYLTIKPLLDGNMLAIGVSNTISNYENICMIYSDLHKGPIHSILIDSVRVQKRYLPDFIEEEEKNQFIVTGYRNFGGVLVPFILTLDHTSLAQIAYNEYNGLNGSAALYTIGIVRSGSGYSIAGDAGNKSNANGFQGVFCLRVDGQYNLVWDRIMLDAIPSSIGCLSESYSDNTIVCGTFSGNTFSGTLYTRSVDTTGNVGDSIEYTDYNNLANFNQIIKTNDDGYILVGTVNKVIITYLVSYTQIYLLKINSDLSEQWSRTFDSSNPLSGVSIFQTSDGGYLVGGYEHTLSTVFTMMMIKTDANGNIVPN